MRIIYLHQYFNTPTMSGSTRSYEMARRLVRRGHEVHIVTSNTSPDADFARGWYSTKESGIDVHWLPMPYSNKMSHARRIRAFIRFAWEAARQATKLGGDVVLASSTPLTIALPALYASKRNKIPMVFEVRDLWPEVPIALKAIRNPLVIRAARWLERLAYRRSKQVVALSPDMRNGVIDRGVEPAKVTVIPNACDFEVFDVPCQLGEAFRAKTQWLGDRPLVVYLGTFGQVNGVGYLARLADRVRRLNPDVRFLVVGSGREEAQVRELARELGVLNENFFMMGPVPKQEVPALLSAATIATSTVIDVQALWANSANKVFDALAGGTPVAINHEGWLADLIRSRQLGLVLDANDLERAAETLVNAVGNADWSERAGRAASAAGRELFDRNALAAKLEAVLDEAVRESHPVPTPRDSTRRQAA